jgi:hypothetical protein
LLRKQVRISHSAYYPLQSEKLETRTCMQKLFIGKTGYLMGFAAALAR